MRDTNRGSCATSADIRQHFSNVKDTLFQACCSTMMLTACINALGKESAVFAWALWKVRLFGNRSAYRRLAASVLPCISPYRKCMSVYSAQVKSMLLSAITARYYHYATYTSTASDTCTTQQCTLMNKRPLYTTYGRAVLYTKRNTETKTSSTS
jgi:hypothetical protein